jgi:hypothetical protein
MAFVGRDEKVVPGPEDLDFIFALKKETGPS